jgi:hypothetical protein
MHRLPLSGVRGSVTSCYPQGQIELHRAATRRREGRVRLETRSGAEA